MTIENIDVNSYPGSEKVYMPGKIHDIKVGMRQVNLTPTVKMDNGERQQTDNAPACIPIHP